jgi:diacylglycerol kinase family enzyme
MDEKMINKTISRWGIVYVPMAGVRKKHRRWHQIKEYLELKKVQYDYIQSEDYGAVERLTRMYVENGYKTIVVVGGDMAVNDEVINDRLMTVCVGNSRGYGLTPSAVPYNGWLDVSIVYRPELTQMIQGLWMLLRGHILNHKQVKPYRTKKVTVVDTEGAVVCIDGRTLDYKCPLEISLMPEYLNFIVPD